MLTRWTKVQSAALKRFGLNKSRISTRLLTLQLCLLATPVLRIKKSYGIGFSRLDIISQIPWNYDVLRDVVTLKSYVVGWMLGSIDSLFSVSMAVSHNHLPRKCRSHMEAKAGNLLH